MNRTYALAWNQAQGCWSAVGETARRRAKPGSAKRVAAALSLLGIVSLPASRCPPARTSPPARPTSFAKTTASRCYGAIQTETPNRDSIR
ncbi:ESPR domain-containing protein [Burkholderia contaminans]|uniref:ESPR domain-containing protein n=1 Tax=Burkholderia contaminans TaxID=488447 RepID=UPI0015825142